MGKKGDVAKIILASVAVAGLLSVALVAPNAVRALAPLADKSRRGLANRRYYIKSAVGRLAARGLVVFRKTPKGKTYLKITPKGRQELLKYQRNQLEAKKTKHWDGKWRVIIFDIKEYRRGDRDCLRNELIRLGFKRLQDSVWIYPHDCEELMALLKSSFGFGRDLLYLTVEHLENDRWLRSDFKLS